MFNQRGSGFFDNIPTVTKNIVIVNFIMWFAEIVFAKQGIDLTNLLGLHFFASSDFHVYQFVTYLFMHDPNGISHVLFNMFAVFMFGRTLESIWGAKRFLIFYLITGIGAGLVQELFWTFQSVPDFALTIGASGAVFGILLAFGMLFPNVELMLLFPPIPIKAKWFVIGYGVMELFLGVASFSGDNVAHFAHLGGMLFGIIMILYWRKTDRNNGRHY